MLGRGDIVLDFFSSRSALVIPLVTQPLHPVCSGDLSRQIAHQQVSLAFGACTACTKAFQIKTFFTVSSRTAKPIRDLVSHVRNRVPAMRFAPAGMTVVLVRFLSRSALVPILVTQPQPLA